MDTKRSQKASFAWTLSAVLALAAWSAVWADPPSAAPRPQTQPTTQPAASGDGLQDPLQRELGFWVDWAMNSALVVPEIKDGKPHGIVVQYPSLNALLQFVIDDYKRRVGPKPEGPIWHNLHYTVVAFAQADHQAIHPPLTGGSGTFAVEGARPASYTFIVLDEPTAVDHAWIVGVLTDKDGGHLDAAWYLEWQVSSKVWWNRRSSTPSAAKEPLPVQIVK